MVRKGIRSGHVFRFEWVSCILIASPKVLLKASLAPFAKGAYAGVLDFWAPRIDAKWDAMGASVSVPWSECQRSGTPNTDTQCLIKALATVSPRLSGMGMAIANLENSQIMVRMCSILSTDRGRLITRSRDTSSFGLVGALVW